MGSEWFLIGLAYWSLGVIWLFRSFYLVSMFKNLVQFFQVKNVATIWIFFRYFDFVNWCSHKKRLSNLIYIPDLFFVFNHCLSLSIILVSLFFHEEFLLFIMDISPFHVLNLFIFIHYFGYFLKFCLMLLNWLLVFE